MTKNIMTISVSSQEKISKWAMAAFRGEYHGARVSFANADRLWRVLNRNAGN